MIAETERLKRRNGSRSVVQPECRRSRYLRLRLCRQRVPALLRLDPSRVPVRQAPKEPALDLRVRAGLFLPRLRRFRACLLGFRRPVTALRSLVRLLRPPPRKNPRRIRLLQAVVRRDLMMTPMTTLMPTLTGLATGAEGDAEEEEMVGDLPAPQEGDRPIRQVATTEAQTLLADSNAP